MLRIRQQFRNCGGKFLRGLWVYQPSGIADDFGNSAAIRSYYACRTSHGFGIHQPEWFLKDGGTREDCRLLKPERQVFIVVQITREADLGLLVFFEGTRQL